MPEFDIVNSGTCFGALTYAMSEAQSKGIEPNTQAWFDYIAVRKYEIWEELENKTYKFSTCNTTL